MSSGALPRPGPRWGSHPQRPDQHRATRTQALWAWPWLHTLPTQSWPGAVLRAALAPALPHLPPAATRWWLRPWLQHLHALSSTPPASEQADLLALRSTLHQQGLQAHTVAQALALIGDIVQRTLGRTLHDTQRMAAALLLDHQLVEMATGEGKTLAMACAAAVAALAGVPVHVVTANDYLAKRDAHSLAPLWQALGLRVAHVAASQTPAERRHHYGHDIVYASAKELAFDHLRDSLAQRRPLVQGHGPGGTAEPPVMRGLCLALLDEADSILLDEAVVPLVISASRQASPGQQAQRRALWWQAGQMAASLQAGTHYQIDGLQARLQPAGQAYLEGTARALGGLWRRPRTREALITLALVANHTLHRDQHYLVRDGHVELLDALSGRVAQGRVWNEGLQALIEIKEGCTLSDPTETQAQITFARFFRRYWRLGGLSGTLAEARAELAQTHGLRVMRLPRRLPDQHVAGPMRVFANTQARWQAVVQRVSALQAQGRPVLIGTDSVAASQALSACLQQAGITHAVLNARHDQHEAQIVAQAGQAGRVTVATRMAGRGTDIQPDATALAAGGLHVIHCQRNESGRMDRQLLGRCARQGQPGSSERWLCLGISNDQDQASPPKLPQAPSTLRDTTSWTHIWHARLRAALAQALASRRQAALRRMLMEQDQQWQALHQRTRHPD